MLHRSLSRRVAAAAVAAALLIAGGFLYWLAATAPNSSGALSAGEARATVPIGLAPVPKELAAAGTVLAGSAPGKAKGTSSGKR